MRSAPSVDGVLVQRKNVLDGNERERGLRVRHFASFSIALPRFVLM